MPLARPRQPMNAGRFAAKCSALALAAVVAATAPVAAYAANNVQIGTVASFSGDTLTKIAIKPDGKRAYVTNLFSGTVSVIDVASNTQTGVVTNFTGQRPNGVAFTPDGVTAYVVNGTSASVSVIRVRGSTTFGGANTAPASGAMLLMPFGR
ncbi:YncE family protein [Burkholderia singularis]|nr:beta-propeller fold lactonase family protein [Burkholderia singularis]